MLSISFTSTEKKRQVVTTSRDLGWVELISKNYKIFHCKIPTEYFWQKLNVMVERHLQSYFLQQTGKLALIESLMEDRLAGPFLLPKVFETYSGHYISTGLSRLSAEIICGVPREEIDGIIVTDDAKVVSEYFEIVDEILSTDDFEKRFKLQDIDYKINWTDDNGKILIYNTILSYSVYSQRAENNPVWIQQNQKRLTFLNRYCGSNGLLKINVACTNGHEKNILYDPTVFDVVVTHQDPDDWHFSYGKLLSRYKVVDDVEPEPSLNLWIFDIDEPVSLAQILMWAKPEWGCYLSKNKKILMFDPSISSSIKEIPNIVK